MQKIKLRKTDLSVVGPVFFSSVLQLYVPHEGEPARGNTVVEIEFLARFTFLSDSEFSSQYPIDVIQVVVQGTVTLLSLF